MRPAQSGPTAESNSLTTLKLPRRFVWRSTSSCAGLKLLTGGTTEHPLVKIRACFSGQTSDLEATVETHRPTAFLKTENQGAKALTDAAMNGCAIALEKLMIVIKNSGLKNVLTGTEGPVQRQAQFSRGSGLTTKSCQAKMGNDADYICRLLRIKLTARPSSSKGSPS